MSTVDLSQKLVDKAAYEDELEQLVLRLLKQQSDSIHHGRRVVVVAEGWDASGKGGAILRMTNVLDPRHVRHWSIAAPSREEQGKHYLYRFWAKLPAPGDWAFFDRSWYGRVLVERVEGFASKKEWQRAYAEINAFEKMLTDDGVVLVKLFFHITKKEQKARLEARQADPLKRWKVTDEDWRNRKRWNDYLPAMDEMFRETSTANAPWVIVPGDYKWFARVFAAKTVATALERGSKKEK